MEKLSKHEMKEEILKDVITKKVIIKNIIKVKLFKFLFSNLFFYLVSGIPTSLVVALYYSRLDIRTWSILALCGLTIHLIGFLLIKKPIDRDIKELRDYLNKFLDVLREIKYEKFK
jgi:hypothetical protein